MNVANPIWLKVISESVRKNEAKHRREIIENWNELARNLPAFYERGKAKRGEARQSYQHRRNFGNNIPDA